MAVSSIFNSSLNFPGPGSGPSTAPYQVSQAAADLLGPNAQTANNLYSSGAPPAAVNNAVNDLFGAQIQSNALNNQAAVTATQDTAQANAENIVAGGDAQEAQAYLKASGIADSNARLARVSGQIQQAQQARTIYQSISGQEADIAGAGFAGNSLDAMYLMRNSVAQGQTTEQMIGTQANINAGGYEQQAAAANAEATAAQAAGAEASELAIGAQSAASLVQSNAASQGAMLQTNALNNAMALLANPNVSGGGGGGGSGGPGFAVVNPTGASDMADKQLGVGNVNAGYVNMSDPGGSVDSQSVTS